MTIWQTLFGGKPQEPLRTVPSFEEEEITSTKTPAEDPPAQTKLNANAAWPFPVAKPTEGLGGITTPLTKEDKEFIQAQQELSAEEAAAQAERIAAKERAFRGELKRSQFARAAELRRQEREELKQVVIDAPRHGIEFVHVGRTTFAWRYHSQDTHAADRRVIDVATAVCNPTDSYAKWHGSAVAAQNLLDGKYITLRIARDVDSVRDGLKMLGIATIEGNYERTEVLYAYEREKYAREQAAEQEGQGK